MTREFIRLPTFEKLCKSMNLTENSIMEIEFMILDNPAIGDIMQGTGGIRKFRYALPHMSKSDGARIIYVDFPLYEKTYLITAYPKSKKGNITPAERNNLKTLVSSLKAELRKRSIYEQSL